MLGELAVGQFDFHRYAINRLWLAVKVVHMAVSFQQRLSTTGDNYLPSQQQE
jgi:predicted SprT family Zn-dependent metalloprotease